ncbi:MAG: caspase family protein [Bacteroidota bacterium]
MSDIVVSRSTLFRVKNYLLAIAINEYKSESDLFNCVKDAEDLIRLLTSEFDFNRENVSFLCGGDIKEEFHDVLARDAQGEPIKPNRRGIIRSLLDVATKIAEDTKQDKDLKVNLILYYSGHGYFDNFLNQGYWIPWDAEKHDFAAYISNSTLRDFLNRIPTHHTVLIADSCFSGSLFMSGEGKSVASSRLEKDKSRWGITAGRNEVVSDGSVGENSPFLKAILEELSKFDVIPISDLGIKVLEKVAANDKQTPRAEPLRISGHDGGQYVFRKRRSARKNMEMGKKLMDLADLHPEYDRFSAANDQFSVAHHLFTGERKKEELLDCTIWQLKALCGMGAWDRAKELITNTLSSLGDYTKKDELLPALVYMSYLADKQLLFSSYEETLQAVSRCHQKGIKNALIHQIDVDIHQLKGDIHILSVGINKYQEERLRLRSCLLDVENLEKAFSRYFYSLDCQGELHTEALLDEDATHDQILDRLSSFKDRLKPDDLFIFQFSGHGYTAKGQEGGSAFLVPQDFSFEEKQSITVEDITKLLDELPVKRKIVFIDADINQGVVDTFTDREEVFLSGGQPGETIGDTVDGGIFSTQFMELFSRQIDETTFFNSLKSNVNRIRKQQTPTIIHGERFFRYLMKNQLSYQLIKSLYGPIKRVWTPTEGTLTAQSVAGVGPHISQTERLTLGRILYSQGNIHEAHAFYRLYLDTYEQDPTTAGHGIAPWKVYLDIAHIQIELADLDHAESSLKKAIDLLGNERTSVTLSLKRLYKKVKASKSHEKYALLVATAKEDKEIIAKWKSVLGQQGFKHIQVLTGEDVQEEVLLTAFTSLAEHAKKFPSFFYFKGEGKSEDEQTPVFLDVHTTPAQDENTEQTPKTTPISVAKLQELASHTAHLLSLLDVNFTCQSGIGEDCQPNSLDTPLIGNACFLSAVTNKETVTPVLKQWGKDTSFSHQIIDTLQQHSHLTFSEFTAVLKKDLAEGNLIQNAL